MYLPGSLCRFIHTLVGFSCHYPIILSPLIHRIVPHKMTTKGRRAALPREERLIMKVLVVDDNKDFADLIQSLLEDEGMEVMSANDGIEGYADYLLFSPDLVITDIQMPGGTGLDMMQHIRTHNPMIKTIYMSGNIDSYRLSLAQEQQRYPVTVFRKPFSLKSLMKLVSESGTSLPIHDATVFYHTSPQQPMNGP
jgi:CheY-like chemotaxis protein